MQNTAALDFHVFCWKFEVVGLNPEAPHELLVPREGDPFNKVDLSLFFESRDMLVDPPLPHWDLCRCNGMG